MRLYSPVPVLARLSFPGGDVLGENEDAAAKPGYTIPGNTAMLVSIWAMHKSKAIWGDDADEFRPERFEQKYPVNAFVPFATGARKCVGQFLAMNEAKVVLGTLLRHYKVELAPGYPDAVTDKYIIPVRPANGLYLRLTPRQQQGAAVVVSGVAPKV